MDGFSESLVEVLSSTGEVQDFGSGASILQHGDCDTHLFHILSGEVRVETMPSPTILGAGELLGEMAFLDNRPRTATAVAVGAVRVRRIERQELIQALCDQPRDIAALIEALSRLQELRLAGESATRELSARDFVAQLANAAHAHRALRHPYLSDLSSGALPDLPWALADFARHYHGYSSHFPRYLAGLISRLEDREHRAALLQNLTEESGQYDAEELAELEGIGIDPEWIVGVPHPILFARFRDALGMSKAQTAEEHIEVVCWREMFLDTLRDGSPAQAVGALGLGTENIVRHLYGPFVDSIEALGTLSPRDTVFFPLHTAVDDHHQDALATIAADLAVTSEDRRDLVRGMHKALSLRAEFWSWLHERALDPEAHADA